MRPNQSNSARHGFTRTDLVAITVVLMFGAVLLLPSLGKGSDRQGVIQCLNNARQLAFAAHLYAADNRDLWPANGLSDSTVSFTRLPTNYTPRVWAEFRQGSATSPETADIMLSPKVSLLANYVQDKNAFRCPDRDAPIRIGNTTFQRPKKYGMNQFVGWTPDRATGVTWHGEPNTTSEIFKTVATTAKPGSIFLFGEIHSFSICHPVFGTHPRWDAAGNPTGENRILHLPANNHGRGTTFSMADGHAESRTWRYPNFNHPNSNGTPVAEGDPFWHTHDTPLPGATSTEVAPDLKWLTVHTTVPK